MTPTCACGCGLPVGSYKQTDKRKGHVAGQPKRFADEHGARGVANGTWRGGRSLVAGYAQVLMPEHPRAHRTTGYVLEHVLIAERALGKPLPPKAEVHHVDGNRTNNSPSNLVICESHAYHALLHRRARALEACGNPDALRCAYCKSHDIPENLSLIRNRADVIGGYHRSCHAKYEAARQARAEARRNGDAEEPKT